MKIYISHSNSYDYKSKLYIPIRESSLNKEHEFFLPHENDRAVNTKDMMKEFDLVLAEVSFPSTGQGIELGRADTSNIPIVCMYEQGSKISGSLKYVTDSFFEYENQSDMITKISEIVNG